MIPQDQRVLGRYGDCWRACIASLLEHPITDVPHFMLDAARQIGLYDAWPLAKAATLSWLEERGLQLVACRADWSGDALRTWYIDRLTYCRAPFETVSERYGIVTGTTKRGGAGDTAIMHSVVADLRAMNQGRSDWLAHDPYPSRAGIVLVYDCYVIRGIP